MKRFIPLACAGLLAAAVATPSFAADIVRPSLKAPVFVAPFSWSGFYVGINGGYGWGTSTWTSTGTSDSVKPKGGLVGGTLGYNLQTGNWVWGIEGDLDWAGIDGTNIGTGICAVGPGCETKNSYLGTIRGRVGYAFDRWLPYFTGGGAFADVRMTPGTGTGSQTNNQMGWTLGGGVEWAFMGAWSAKLEYLYVDLGNSTCDAATCVISTTVNEKLNVVRAGINYRF
jgi:outer membrane immunogenic protein